MPGYSESTCKYCAVRIFWRIASRYFDILGDLHNSNLPRNADGTIHRCCQFGCRQPKALLPLEESL